MSEDSLKSLWNLDPSWRFLNHGSYGAVPRHVSEKQFELYRHIESQPVRFFARELEGMLAEARSKLASFLNADPEGLVFVPNATTGVNTVVKSLAFCTKDEVLITNHTYNACRNAVELAVKRWGAQVKVVNVPFPKATPEAVLEAILSGVTSKTRLLLIDHITSPTALIFPVKEIVEEMSARGIDVIVDGAHAPGMVSLDLRQLGAAYYTGNCHKWLCAPKGSAFLYIREDLRKLIRPLTTSHGANSTRTDKSFLHLEFDWTGTGDYTPFIMVPHCIEFLNSLYPGGIEELMKRNRDLALWARTMLCERFNVPLPCPDDMIGSLAAVPILPMSLKTGILRSTKVVDEIQERLFKEYSIEVPVISWPDSDKRLVRISAQAYNTKDEYEVLASAIEAILRG